MGGKHILQNKTCCQNWLKHFLENLTKAKRHKGHAQAKEFAQAKGHAQAFLQALEKAHWSTLLCKYMHSRQ